MPQEAFGGYAHDSLQYHFFCGPLVGAARLFRTPTLEHASLWIHDGAGLTEFAHSTGPLVQGAGDGLSTAAGGLSFAEDADGVAIRAEAAGVAIRLAVGRELRWDDTISTVVHQPDLACELSFRGQRLTGTGYCKRYCWTPAPRHWGYRFVQGHAGTGADAFMVWTAEATFGTAKYDYCKMLTADGTLHEADPAESCHRQDAVHARIGSAPLPLALEELAVWEAHLVSPAMDSLLRQRVCRLTATLDGRVQTGLAINETCYGTLG